MRRVFGTLTIKEDGMEFYEIADKIIRSILERRVSEQFIELKVVAISLQKLPMPFCGQVILGLQYSNEELVFLPNVRAKDIDTHSIILNSSHSIIDWIYTIAHELGHILCEEEKIHAMVEGVFLRENFKAREYIAYSEELFCEIFSSLWVNYGNNKQELSEIVSVLSPSNHKIIF